MRAYGLPITGAEYPKPGEQVAWPNERADAGSGELNGVYFLLAPGYGKARRTRVYLGTGERWTSVKQRVIRILVAATVAAGVLAGSSGPALAAEGGPVCGKSFEKGFLQVTCKNP